MIDSRFLIASSDRPPFFKSDTNSQYQRVYLLRSGDLEIDFAHLVDQVQKTSDNIVDQLKALKLLKKELTQYRIEFPKDRRRTSSKVNGLKSLLTVLENNSDYKRTFPRTRFEAFEGYFEKTDPFIVLRAEGLLDKVTTELSIRKEQLQIWRSKIHNPEILAELLRSMDLAERQDLKDLCISEGKKGNFDLAEYKLKRQPITIRSEELDSRSDKFITHFFLNRVSLSDEEKRQANFGWEISSSHAWMNYALKRFLKTSRPFLSNEHIFLLQALATCFAQSARWAAQLEQDASKKNLGNITNQIIDSIQELLNSPIKYVIIPTGYIIKDVLGNYGHATALIAKLNRDGSCTLTHCNSGSGVSLFHPPAKDEKYQLFREFDAIPFQALLNIKAWKKILKVSFVPLTDDLKVPVEELYHAIGELESNGIRLNYTAEQFYMPMQEKETCTVESCFALIHHRFLTESNHIQKNAVQYAEFKAAFDTMLWEIKPCGSSEQIEQLARSRIEDLALESLLLKLVNEEYNLAVLNMKVLLNQTDLDSIEDLESIDHSEKYDELKNLSILLSGRILNGNINFTKLTIDERYVLQPAFLIAQHISKEFNEIIEELEASISQIYDSTKITETIATKFKTNKLLRKYPTLKASLIKHLLHKQQMGAVLVNNLLVVSLLESDYTTLKEVIRSVTQEEEDFAIQLLLNILQTDSTYAESPALELSKKISAQGFKGFCEFLIRLEWLGEHPLGTECITKIMIQSFPSDAHAYLNKIADLAISAPNISEQRINSILFSILQVYPERPEFVHLAQKIALAIEKRTGNLNRLVLNLLAQKQQIYHPLILELFNRFGLCPDSTLFKNTAIDLIVGPFRNDFTLKLIEDCGIAVINRNEIESVKEIIFKCNQECNPLYIRITANLTNLLIKRHLIEAVVDIGKDCLLRKDLAFINLVSDILAFLRVEDPIKTKDLIEICKSHEMDQVKDLAIKFLCSSRE